MRSIATANVLVTDIIGSTAVLTGEGEQAAERQRHRHDAVVRSVLAVFGGQVVKSTGDGVLAILPSADFAICAAAALQQAATAEQLPLRVGVSTGDVLHEAGDCFGEAVVTAFRLCAQCPVGAALVDAATATVRGGRRDPPVEPYDRLLLRGFDRPIDVLSVEVDADDGVVSTGAVADEPLIGRDELLARVESAWSSRQGSLVVVLGVPGIGKTHLAAAISRTTGRPPWWLTFELQQTDGFGRWCAAADERASTLPVGLLASLGPAVLERLASLLPSIGDRLPVTPAPLSPDVERNDLFSALIDFVRVAGRGSVMVLDDLQWAGSTFFAFLTALASSPQAHGVDLLATCRQPMPLNLSELGATVVEVGRLGVDEVGEMLALRGVAPAVAEVAARQSGGNPLLALMAARPGTSPVDDPVTSRFLALPPDEVDVLAVAALIGRVVDLPLIARLTGSPLERVAAHLDAAAKGGLLRQQDDGALTFVHELVREAAERHLAPHRLALLHARAAEELSGRGDVAGAIRHCLDGFVAMEPDEAVDRVTAGCAALSQRMSFEDVVNIARRLAAIVTADARCRPRHVAAAMLLASRAHQALGEIEAHKESALSAGRAALADSDHVLLAAAAIERVAWGIAGIPDPEAEGLLDEALTRTPASEEALRAKLMSMKAFYLFNYEARGEEAYRWAVEAIHGARRSENKQALTMALANFSFVLNASSRVDEHTAVLDELESLPGLPGLAELDTTLHRHGAVVRLQLADRAGFAAHHARVVELSRHRSDWVLTSIATLWDGLSALLDGRPQEAESHAWTLLQRNDHNFTASAAGVLTASHRWRGTLGETIGQIINFARAQPGLPIATSMAAVSAAIGGDRTTATRLVDELISRPAFLANDSTLAGQLALLTEACTLVGRPIPSVVVDGLAPFSGQLLVLAWGVDLPGAADRFLAIAMAQAGDRDGASAAFARAAQLERRVSAVVPLRTELWRHAMLGGSAPAAPDPALAGLDAESAALAGVRSR